MQLKLYIIPGLGQKPTDAPYIEITKLARKSGYATKLIEVDWNQAPNMWLAKTKKQLNNSTKKDVILGFSFGAYIAAVLSPKIKSSKFIFCSISPYFLDDKKNLPKLAYKYLGEKLINELTKNKFPTASKSPAAFLIGDKDLEIVIERTKKSYRAWNGPKETVIVKNVGHALGKRYLKEIARLINN